jgi:hypothetical protein
MVPSEKIRHGRFAKLILNPFRPEIDNQVVSTVFDNKILLFWDLR